MTQFAHKQLWEAISDQLRDEILDGRLGAGTRLVETELAERFGVSRGPIRDALAELARAGLAVDLPRRGTFVSSLTERDLEEVYVLRRAIEEAAIPFAIANATEDDVAAMLEVLAGAEAAYGKDDLAAAWEADMAFHRTLLSVVGQRTPAGPLRPPGLADRAAHADRGRRAGGAGLDAAGGASTGASRRASPRETRPGRSRPWGPTTSTPRTGCTHP